MSRDGLTVDPDHFFSEKPLVISTEDRKSILPAQLYYLYKSSVPNVIGNLLCAIMIIVLCWRDSSRIYVSEIYWFSAFLGLLVTRLILYKLFLKSNLSKNPQKWLYGLAFLVGLSAIIWGCALVFLYNRGNSDGVLTLLLGTMAGMPLLLRLPLAQNRLQ